MLTFFHSPGSCSNGIALLLHELGTAFDCHVVNLREGDQKTPAYRSVNSKGKVPAIRMADGAVLTEFAAIACWLAEEHPGAGLWPSDARARARICEALDFMIGSVHMRGFTLVKMPQKFIDTEAGQAAIRAYGRSEVDRGLAILSDMMGDGDYLFGDFSVADTALFFLLSWTEEEGIAMPDNLSTGLARIRARPAFAAAEPMLRR